MPAARKTFARILAINHSVEIAEVLAAVTFARPGAAELACIRECIFHAIGVAGMTGQKIQCARIGAAGAAP